MTEREAAEKWGGVFAEYLENQWAATLIQHRAGFATSEHTLRDIGMSVLHAGGEALERPTVTVTVKRGTKVEVIEE